MILKSEDTNDFYSVCDCCYDRSDSYRNWNECSHAIKMEGWQAHYNADEGVWEHFCPDCMKG